MSPTLESVLEAAIDATGAEHGWILASRGDTLEVRVIAGADAGLVGTAVAAQSGFAGYVASSGQPLAMSPRRDDPRGSEGVAALAGVQPWSVLAVPCTTDDAVLGVMELVDKHGGGPFSFDDVELATLLAGVAGAALAADDGLDRAVPSPRELSGGLERLASSDPARYATLATFLTSVLPDE